MVDYNGNINEALQVSVTAQRQLVQWLRLHASTAGSLGSILGWGTKIPHAINFFFLKRGVTDTWGWLILVVRRLTCVPEDVQQHSGSLPTRFQ